MPETGRGRQPTGPLAVCGPIVLSFALVLDASVRFRLPDGTICDLVPGDVIGRLWTTAGWIADPRVSEAHALISLYGPKLMLLALQGRLTVDGRPKTEVELKPRRIIHLADGLAIVTEQVHLPASVFALEGEGCPRQTLLPIVSVVTFPKVRLTKGHHPDAAAVVWTDGSVWKARTEGQDLTLEVDTPFLVEGRPFYLRTTPRTTDAPFSKKGRGAAPLTLEQHPNAVHLLRPGETPLKLQGPQAGLLTQLAQHDAPVDWMIAAEPIWPDEPDPQVLRQKWDETLSRLRSRLKVARIRPNLVQVNGRDRFTLSLTPHDRWVDKT